MKQPQTKKQLSMLCVAIVIFVAIECLCSCYYPKLFIYVFLSGLIWLMLLLAWPMDEDDKEHMYHKYDDLIDKCNSELYWLDVLYDLNIGR